VVPTPIWRPSARLLVLDPLSRVLFFSFTDAEGNTLWFTPGGGIRAGETLAGAAVRELAEETGYVVAETDIGPVVATCSGQWTSTEDGMVYFGADSFFLVRVSHSLVSTDGQDSLERSIITGHRWWTPEELRSADDAFLPKGLPGLIARLLADGVPDHPVRLPWRGDF
jgi:8-oxo-dGTP pyrophosphatase MutT (NUDIX family)